MEVFIQKLPKVTELKEIIVKKYFSKCVRIQSDIIKLVGKYFDQNSVGYINQLLSIDNFLRR